MGYYTVYRRLRNKKLISHVCFSRQFEEYFDYVLHIYTNYDLTKLDMNHKVVLSNKDINLFLRILKQELGGINSTKNITVNELLPQVYDRKTGELDDITNVRCKEITIKLDKCKYTDKISQKLVYKIVSTYLRYLYEDPFNIILKKAIKAYRKDGSIHLFTYLYHAHKDKMYNSGHSIVRMIPRYKNFKFMPLDKDLNTDKFKEYKSVQDLAELHKENSELSIKEYELVKKLIKW